MENDVSKIYEKKRIKMTRILLLSGVIRQWSVERVVYGYQRLFLQKLKSGSSNQN